MNQALMAGMFVDYFQSMFSLCSVYVQSMFSLCSVYVQSMFSLCSVYVQCEVFAIPDINAHITGDISFAVQQLWYASGDKEWLTSVYPGLLNETARFWASRVEYTGMDGKAHINHIIPPDEYATGDDSVYTNFVARRNLLFAAEAAAIVGDTTADAAHWVNVSSAIPLLFDQKRGVHWEYEGYTGGKIKQADAVLLGFPLMLNMSKTVRKADLDYYAPRTDPGGPAMTWGMHAVGYLELNDGLGGYEGGHEEGGPQKDDDGDDGDVINSNFNRSFANAQPPFYVWTETPTGGAVNFLTGVGGFLQTVLFGLPGMRVWPDHLAFKPALVQGMSDVTVRGVHYRSAVFALSYTNESMTFTAAAGNKGLTVVLTVGAVGGGRFLWWSDCRRERKRRSRSACVACGLTLQRKRTSRMAWTTRRRLLNRHHHPPYPHHALHHPRLPPCPPCGQHRRSHKRRSPPSPRARTSQ